MKAMLVLVSVFMFAWSIGYAQQIKTNPAINKQVAGTQVLTNKNVVKVNGNVPFLKTWSMYYFILYWSKNAFRLV